MHRKVQRCRGAGGIRWLAYTNL